MNTKFSVLLSVYIKDNPEYLRIALKSIYEDQTLKPDDIVIVCDGPLNADLYNVLSVFQSGKEEIVNIISLPENVGLGDALKIGSEKCVNEYIMRMDSDDISLPQRFEKQMNYMLEHPDIDVLGSNIAEFTEDINQKLRIRTVPQKHSDIEKMSKHRNPMNHVSVCIKKSALDRCGGYEGLLLLEDYYLWLKMIINKCRLENIPESLVYVRTGKDFVNKRGSRERIEGWKTLQEYMIKHRLINHITAIINMVSIWTFVNTPVNLKNYLYKMFLRK